MLDHGEEFARCDRASDEGGLKSVSHAYNHDDERCDVYRLKHLSVSFPFLAHAPGAQLSCSHATGRFMRYALKLLLGL